jgi:hypothetical protein
VVRGEFVPFFPVAWNAFFKYRSVQYVDVVGAKYVIQLGVVGPIAEIVMGSSALRWDPNRRKDIAKGKFQKGFVLELMHAPNEYAVKVPHDHAFFMPGQGRKAAHLVNTGFNPLVLSPLAF